MQSQVLCLNHAFRFRISTCQDGEQSFNLEEPASVERALNGLALAGRFEGELPDTLIHVVNRLVALFKSHAKGEPGRQECRSCFSYEHVSYTSSANSGTLKKAEGKKQAAR